MNQQFLFLAENGLWCLPLSALSGISLVSPWVIVTRLLPLLSSLRHDGPENIASRAVS